MQRVMKMNDVFPALKESTTVWVEHLADSCDIRQLPASALRDL